MMRSLNRHELVALITEALQQAAEALAIMTRSRIVLQPPVLVSAMCMNLQSESGYYVLTTEIKGELQGKSYLVLEGTEANWLIGRLNVRIDPEAECLTGMQQSALLELDNVLSAAAITRIANQLQLFCYGDVPALQYMSASQLQAMLAAAETAYPLLLQASYQSADLQLKASFIWMFEAALSQSLNSSHL